MTRNDLKLIEERYCIVTEQSKLIDKLQGALDIIGFDPSIGTGADALNTLISSMRAALAKEKDERKRHLINAGISAISLIPFADVIKVLKLRKLGGLGRTVKKSAVSGSRVLKGYAKAQKATGRFNSESSR